jgi:hypothetical protein
LSRHFVPGYDHTVPPGRADTPTRRHADTPTRLFRDISQHYRRLNLDCMQILASQCLSKFLNANA